MHAFQPFLTPVFLFGSNEKLWIPENLYNLSLSMHSGVRYIVSILLLLAILYAYRGWKNDIPYKKQSRKLGMFTVIAADIQLITGIVVYCIFFYSGTGLKKKRIVGNLELVQFQYFVVEHALAMVTAIVLLHIGYRKAKKADDMKGNKIQFNWFLIALIIILLAIPWPFLPKVGRPLF